MSALLVVRISKMRKIIVRKRKRRKVLNLIQRMKTLTKI
jgi:hypothetical protein